MKFDSCFFNLCYILLRKEMLVTIETRAPGVNFIFSTKAKQNMFVLLNYIAGCGKRNFITVCIESMPRFYFVY
jgi:hypothetical protein